MKNKLKQFGAIIWTLIVLTACSEDSEMSKLLGHVPENADAVVVGDLTTIAKSAGGSIEASTLKMPAFLIEKLPESFIGNVNELNSILEKGGIDADACAWMLDYENRLPVCLFALSDRAMFVNMIHDNGFRKQSNKAGVIYYTREDNRSSDGKTGGIGYIAIKDSYAYWTERDWTGSFVDPVVVLGQLIDDAEAKSLAETSFGDYIVKGNAFGAFVRMPRGKSGLSVGMSGLSDGAICFNGNLDGNVLTLNFEYLDKEGRPISENFSEYYDVTAKISSKALSYMGPDESFIYAGSLKNVDWDGYFESMFQASGLSQSDMAMLPVIKAYLEKIDGTMALGVGFTNGLESIFNLRLGEDVMSQFAMTVLIELKPGEADALLEVLTGLLESAQIPYEAESSEIAFEIPQQPGGSVFAKAVDNMLIFSNHEIKSDNENPTVNAIPFSSYISGLGFVLNRDNRLVRDVHLSNDIQFAVTSNSVTGEGTLTLEIEGGTQEGVIAKIAEIILNVAEQRASLYQQWEEYGDSDYSRTN